MTANFRSEIYPWTLYVCTHPTYKEFSSLFLGFNHERNEVFEITEEAYKKVLIDGNNASAVSVVTKDTGEKGICVVFTQENFSEITSKMVNTMVHEALHIADFFYEYMDMELSGKKDHAYIYLAGWIAEKIYEAIESAVLLNHVNAEVISE